MTAIQGQAKDWRTIITLAFSGLGLLFFLVQSLALGVFWVSWMLNPQTEPIQNIPAGLLFWSSLLGGALLLPLLLLSINKLRNQPAPAWLDNSRPVVRNVAMWLILVWPVIVFLGWLVADNPDIAVFLLGPINLLVASIPILWIVNAVQRKLKSGFPIRKWRIFGFSLTVTPLIIIIVEFIVLTLMAVIGILWLSYRLSVDPSLEHEITYIQNQINLAGNDLELILQLLESYILTPTAIFWAVAIIGGIMPIIEEIIKPLALWSLAGRRITPQEGFVNGLLCGAGFALMENVLYATTIIFAEDWLLMAVTRGWTIVVHMLASGLVGWGLAKLWRDGKWKFMVLTTLGAFLLHGLWNTLALVCGLAPLYVYDSDPTLGQTLLFYSPLILLFIISAVVMFLVHRYLLKQQSTTESEIKPNSDINEDIPDNKVVS
jgi:RsiW-degrading membrane proteinase PrsW (M82 family)